MGQLAFHTNVPDPFIYICLILKKAQRLGMSVSVLMDNEEDLQKLDELIWTFDKQSFIPHARTGSPDLQFGAFQLARRPEELNPAEMLVIGSRFAPSDMKALLERFPRIIDIVGTKDPFLTLGRNRWRAYRAQGIEAVVHDRSKGA